MHKHFTERDQRPRRKRSHAALEPEFGSSAGVFVRKEDMPQLQAALKAMCPGLRFEVVKSDKLPKHVKMLDKPHAPL